MKKYTLASPEARKNVDLRNHSDIIIKAVHDVVPNAVVDVYEDHYTVDNITKGQSIKVGRKFVPLFWDNTALPFINCSMAKRCKTSKAKHIS